MDLSKRPNPFDFANPVTVPSLFVGRKKELGDIRYYLDHTHKTARPINLAIMGERASGKTSMLNIVQGEAEKKGFCVVRINLDEADAQSQLAFFYKIFDSFLTTACSSGVYEGRGGETYQNYRNMVDAYETPNDKLFCPFVFPFQYAKAMASGNERAILSDTAFKEDIVTIQKELRRPVVLLFDECDVLTKTRVHLEKLRNIFMNTTGFMLVITGTPALFPLMDDVFSPIIRQFKKILLGPFETTEETENCIRGALESIGISHPFHIIHRMAIREIHDLSAGRPYEIQLICHLLFRRLQEGRTKHMELNLDVLDDVRKELETSQDISLRPILAAVRNFEKQQLSALNVLCGCNGRATFDQIWFSEYVFWGDIRWSKDSLEVHLRRFLENNIVKVRDGIITFAGDDFDRIYCKYFARKRGASLSIVDRSYEVYLVFRLNSFLFRKDEKTAESLTFRGPEIQKPEFDQVAKDLLVSDGTSDPFVHRAEIATTLYWASVNFRKCQTFKIATIGVISPWITVYLSCRSDNPEGASAHPIENLQMLLAECSERAAAIGGQLTVDVQEMPVIPISELVGKVERSDNARLREMLSERHLQIVTHSYIENRDREEALFHGDLSYRYNHEPASQNANNLGYLFLALGDLKRARKLLERAVEHYADPDLVALPYYNLGVLELRAGNNEAAFSCFERAVQESKTKSREALHVGCLLVPKCGTSGDALEFEEMWQVNVRDALEAANSVIGQLRRK